MLISRKKFDTMQRCVEFNKELVRQYSQHMIKLAEENGQLQSELDLAKKKISRLRFENATLKNKGESTLESN